jgi:hypothetical protein
MSSEGDDDLYAHYVDMDHGKTKISSDKDKSVAMEAKC